MNAYQKLALERGWNDLQIAEYVGLSRSTVRNWLNGHRVPGAAAVRLLEVLEILDDKEAVIE